MIKTVLFDLDGTLADTAPDLADALNRTLAKHDKPLIPFKKIRPVVSHGGRALIELGFGITDSATEFEQLRQDLLAFYQDDISRHTQLFAGIDDLLAQLQRAGLNWGIVTNKPAWLTEPLLRSLDIDIQARAVVSGDTLPEKKPHPAPLLHASRQCHSKPEECVYIGDAERDIIAGKRAGMLTLAALYGYIGEHENPIEWHADGYIRSPAEILPWVDAVNDKLTQNQDRAKR